MKHRRHIPLILALFVSFSATVVLAQSGQFISTFDLTGFAFSNGGGASTGEEYMLSDALGQPVIGELSGGNYMLTSGLLTGSPTVDNLVLLYFNGDNNLFEEVLEAARQAQAGATITQTTTVVLMVLDGPKADDSFLYRLDHQGRTDCNFYAPMENNMKCAGRYLLEYNMQKFDENLGAPETLTRFIVEALQAYPGTKHVLLSLVGHGGGWSPNVLASQPKPHVGQPAGLGGLLWDNNALAPEKGSSLSTIELGQALQEAQGKTKRKIDLLYLDACLMGMWEVANEVQGSVDYLLASESWTFTAFTYDRLLHELAVPQSVAQTGAAWLQHKANALGNSGYALTYSLINLTQLPTLNQAVNTLAAGLIGRLPAETEKIQAAFRETDCFDSDQDSQQEHGSATEDGDAYCDLFSFATRLKDQFDTDAPIISATQAVTEALVAVMVKKHDENGRIPPFDLVRGRPGQWVWKHSGGLSIYLPLNEKDDWKRQFYGQLRSSAGDNGWDEFINKYRNDANAPTVPACPDPCTLPAGPLVTQQTVYFPLIHR